MHQMWRFVPLSPTRPDSLSSIFAEYYDILESIKFEKFERGKVRPQLTPYQHKHLFKKQSDRLYDIVDC